jgi:hypothetical protein
MPWQRAEQRAQAIPTNPATGFANVEQHYKDGNRSQRGIEPIDQGKARRLQ